MQLEELQYTAKGHITDAFGLLSRFLVVLFAATTVFPGEIYRAPKCWAERAYHKLIYFHEVEKGGHFAAWEQPELFAAELRAAFSSLR
jgi:pimeloyl-ACP methyl ester carboxylesterase